MINKFFAWKFSGVVIVLFYGLAAMCWALGHQSEHYRLIFVLGAMFLVGGLFASLGWVWRSPLFRSVRTVYTRRYSDQQLYRHSDIVAHEYVKTQPERRSFGVKPRKGKKSTRRALTACFVGLFLVALLGMALTMKAPRPVNNRARVDIFLSDGVETRTRQAPVMPRSIHSRSLVFALANVPIKEVQIHHADSVMTMQVVLRNMSAAEIKGIHVEVSSNTPITPGDVKGVSLSTTEVGETTGALAPYANTKQEQVIKVNVAIPHPHTTVGLYVTVTGPNVQAAAGVENVNFSEIQDSGAAGTAPRPKLSHVATAVR